MRHRYTVIFNEVDSEILNRSIQVLAETPHEAAVRAKVMSTNAGIDAQDFVVIAGWNKILLYEGEIADVDELAQEFLLNHAANAGDVDEYEELAQAFGI